MRFELTSVVRCLAYLVVGLASTALGEVPAPRDSYGGRSKRDRVALIAPLSSPSLRPAPAGLLQRVERASRSGAVPGHLAVEREGRVIYWEGASAGSPPVLRQAGDVVGVTTWAHRLGRRRVSVVAFRSGEELWFTGRADNPALARLTSLAGA